MKNDLYQIKNLKHRMVMAKFRLSNHKLIIETGMHKNITNVQCIPVKQRMKYSLFKGPMHSNKVEDEIHFILECQCYSQKTKLALFKA